MTLVFHYQYLAGVEFKQKIEGIVEAFTSMQDQLNKERRAKYGKGRRKSDNDQNQNCRKLNN
ncbi:MAG: hypothetical protein JRF60_12935 [Deltaproteobacteria bacterium]|nr:hypothetical protein [Deltaproteobacteria bacterium]